MPASSATRRLNAISVLTSDEWVGDKILRTHIDDDTNDQWWTLHHPGTDIPAGTFDSRTAALAATTNVYASSP